MTVTNIAAGEKIIGAKPRVTTREIQESLNSRTAATVSALQGHPRVRQRGARWITHSMRDKQLRVKVEWCEFMLREFNGGRSKLTWEGLTGDETWIYRHDLETKMQSVVWLFPDESPPLKTQKITQRTEENSCLFLRKIEPCRHHSSLGQNDCHRGLVRA